MQRCVALKNEPDGNESSPRYLTRDSTESILEQKVLDHPGPPYPAQARKEEAPHCGIDIEAHSTSLSSPTPRPRDGPIYIHGGCGRSCSVLRGFSCWVRSFTSESFLAEQRLNCKGYPRLSVDSKKETKLEHSWKEHCILHIIKT